MPLTFDETDFEDTAEPLTFSAADFAASPAELEEGMNFGQQAVLKAESPYFGTGQTPFDPMTGSFIGPVSQQEKYQFAGELMKDPLVVPKTIIGAAENAIATPIGWLQRNLRTVPPQPAAAPRVDLEEEAKQSAIERIRRESGLPPTEPKEGPSVPNITPSEAGITPETPMLPMPAESERGIVPGIQRFVSPMTSSVGAAQLPFFEYRPVRALAAAGSIASIPETIRDISSAKTPGELKEAWTRFGLNAIVAGGLTRSLKSKGVPNASQVETPTTVHGDVRPLAEPAGPVPVKEGGPGVQPQAEAVAKGASVPLSAEEQSYLDAERAGLSAGVEVGPEHLEGGQPFAQNQAATINRKTGNVVINPDEFKAALSDLPPERRQSYVRSLLAEEENHLSTSPEDADAYAKAMTGVERALETRAYTGKWTRAGAEQAHGMELTDRTLGYEGLRRRMQQLARMSPTEVAQAVGAERWKMEGINVLQRMISRTMETLPTDRSNLRRAILEKVQGNLDAARFVAAGGNPASLSRPKDQIDDQMKMDAKAFTSQWGTGKAGLTSAAYRMGEKISSEDIPELLKLRDSISKQDMADLKAGKPNTMGLKGQYIGEAVKWRQALDEAHAMGDPTLEDFASLEKKYGVGEGLTEKGEDLKRAFDSEMSPAPLNALVELPKTVVTAEDYKRFGIPEPKPGTVRLYNGSFLSSGASEAWWTDNPYRAGSFGDRVQYIDVTDDQARQFKQAAQQKGQGGSSHFITDNAVLKDRKTVPNPPMQKAHEISMDKTPSSLRRPKPPKEHPELLLPSIKPAEAPAVERGGFRHPQPGEIEKITDQFFGNVRAAGKIPSFEEFSNTLRGQFGSQVSRDAVYYAWTDSLTKNLMQASGDELTSLMNDLGLKRDIAEAVKPNMRDPFIGKIPDKLDEEALRGEFEKLFKGRKQITQQEFQGFLKNNKWITQGRLAPGQKVRAAVIGGILDKLTQRAGEVPDKPWTRTEIGPEDIAQSYLVEGALPKAEAERIQAGQEPLSPMPQVESRRMITRIPAEQAGNAEVVGKVATANSAVDATGKAAPPRTVSKNVMALLDRDGRVTLVSAWKDPRTGPKITNPTAPTLPGEKITNNLLKSWSPLVVMTLRDPVQKFHKTFDSVKDFEQWFGDVGIEGTPGIKTTSVQPMVKGKGAGPYRSVPQEVSPLAGEVGEQPAPATPSPTARDISTLRSRAPTEVAGAPRGTGPAPETSPVPVQPTEMLSPEAQQALSAELSKPNPAMGEAAYRTLAHREVPKKKYTLESSLRYGVSALRERDPSSLRRAAQSANDESVQLFKTFRAMATRRTVKADLPRILDGQERIADQYARQVGEIIRMVSSKSSARADVKQARMVRAAAKAVIASTNRVTKSGQQPALFQFTPNGLDLLRRDVQSGRTKAEIWKVSRDLVKRQWAGKYLKAADRLEKEIDYARDHWDDPELQRTAAQILKEGKDEVDFENSNGFDVNERAYYLPGRYEGEFWSDQQVAFAPFSGTRKLLGEQYRGGKRFRDMYEAIANGPFIPATYDPAVLMESRVRSGRYRVAAAQAREMWKEIKDPETKKPIATAPKMVPRTDPETGQVHYEPFPPSLEYSNLIWPSENHRGVPLAVSDPYAKMIRSLSRTSQIGDMPVGRQALLAASMLKHGWLLIGDMFHFSRLSQYGATLSGKRWYDINPNFKGGFSVLNWRRADLPEAVQKGFITQEAADWANGTVRIRNRDGTYTDHYRTEVGRALLKNGLNASRVMDALYKDAVRNIPLVGESWHKIIGPYNRWLFDKYTSGLMLQKAVENFERLHEKFPERDLQGLTRDVVRDMNMEFGNMGRQGIFRNPTFRDMAQIFLLAPMWREGIIGKEVIAYSRLARAAGRLAAGDLRGAQYHVSTPVTRSMLRGVAAYFVLTQVLNLISRKQFTWQNQEKDHKMDAFIPTGKDSGFWLSPNSVFMEMTHDVNRLLGSRPRAHDALLQIGANALGPVGKAAHVIATGEDDFGRRISTTPRIWSTAASELAPLPMSFGAPARALGHKLAPNLISPPRAGALQRQMLGWAGMKVQPSESTLVQVERMANDFTEKNNLKPDTGFYLQPTDAPSYSALRSALRNDDVKEARRVFEELRKTHPLKRDSKGNVIDDPILKAMAMWSKRPLTGSYDNEAMFLDSLSDRDFELYNSALVERQDMLNKYVDWYITNSGE